MPSTRSTNRDSTGRPILGQNSVVASAVVTTAPTVSVTTYTRSVPITTHTVSTTTPGPMPTSSSTAPPIPSVLQDAANSFNTSFWSHGSVHSPNYSVLTGLQQPSLAPGVPTGQPAVSTGVLEIINTAVGLARREMREEVRSLLGVPNAIPSYRPPPAGYTAPNYAQGQIPSQASIPSALAAGQVTQPPPQPNLSVPPPVQGPQGGPHAFAAYRPPLFSNMEFPPEGGNPYGFRPPASFYSESSGRLNLDKWGIRFDGTEKTVNVQEFIFRVGQLKRDFNCPEDEFLTKFHQLLDKPALDWYWNQRKFVNFRSWSELETALLNQYQQYENEFQIQMKILNRRQLPHETFDDFYNSVLKLRTQQKTPYQEHDMVEIMRGNLKPSLAQMIFSAQIRSLGEFYRQVKRAENLIWSQRQHQQRYNVPQRLHELDWQQEEVIPEEMEVDAISTPAKYKCWNCGVWDTAG